MRMRLAKKIYQHQERYPSHMLERALQRYGFRKVVWKTIVEVQEGVVRCDWKVSQ